jgi:hypothetical protein
MDTIDVVKLWKKSKIEKCEMTFSCGGDSMNDYHFKFFDKENKEVRSKILQDYFENEVYNEVTFYEASDGHYQGEFGKVVIELNEEDEEPNFTYAKQSKSEWSENYTDVIDVKLTEKEINFIKENVSAIGGNYDEDTEFVYKKDLFLTDEDEKIIDSIGKKVYDEGTNFEPDAEGEPEEWFSYTTGVNESGEIYIVDNYLKISVSRNVVEVKEEEDGVW